MRSPVRAREHADIVQDEFLVGLDAAERLQLGDLLNKLLDSHAPPSA